MRGGLVRLLAKVGAVLAGLALLWTLGIGWALPRLLQPRIEAAATTALGAPLAIDKLEIAPWSLEAKVSGLRLGPVDAPWLKVTEVLADVSIASVWRLAPVLDRLRVLEPVVEIERLDATRFNVSPMLDALGRRPAAPPDAQPARFALNNLSLEGGRIRFTDRVTRTEHRIDALKIGVPFISNLPSDVALDVEPLLDATINGSRLTARGKTLPFQEGLRSSIDVDWKQIDVAAWFAALTPLLSHKPPVTLDQGWLDLALQIDFERRTAPQVPSVRVRGALLLSQLKASMPAKSTSLAWERLEVTGLDLRPLEQQARIGQVRLQAPVIDVDLPRWLAPDSQPAAVPPKAAVAAAEALASNPASAPGAPAGKGAWQWTVDNVALVDGRVALQHPGWPKAQALTVPAIEVKGLDSRPDAAPATLALQLADERAATVKVDATLGVAARQVSMKADVAGLKLVPWLAPWQALLPVDLLDASLAVQAQAEAGSAGWAVDKTAVQLTGLQLQPRAAGGGAPRTGVDKLSLPRLAVQGVQVRAMVGQPMAVEVASVQLENLDLHGARDERGALGWLLAQAQSQAAAPAPVAAAPALQWRVDELRCTGCSVAMSDLRVTPAVQLAITRTDLTLRALSADLGKPVGFELVTFAGRSGKGGKLQLRGEVRPQPLSVKTRLDLDALDLSFLQAYLDPVANLTLVSAKASAAGDLSLEGTAQHAVSDLRWTGRFALGELRALDKVNEAELLRFKQLSLDAMDVAWKPAGLQLDLGNVALEDFYGRVIVNADGRINLRDVAKRGGEDRSLTTPTTMPDDAAAAAPQAAPEAPAAAASAPESTDSPPQLRWRSIRLAGGEINFTDNFIRPNYSARLTDIAGTVSALAWNDTESAKVQISGKVDGSAPLEISGTMHPLGPRLATDITASARGVDITRLTAYSGRYAGYGIEKGTLSVKLHYKIVDGKLEAENNIYLDQLTFGDKVDSPNALKLPVLLAVSLLKDRNGVIDINLPISGSLDDPQFSVGAIVVRVIVNLITKAITAPFSLLASAFGGGGEELGYVEFDPGSSVLTEASTKRLDTLAKALLDRPALKLEVTGRADAAQDEAAIREQYLDSLMRTAKAKSSGDLPDSVKIEPADRERWLTAAYKAADLKTKPRNALGLAKSLPPNEMEALLLASAPAGDPELLALADTRGNRVKAYLTTKVPPEQVQLTASKLGAEGLPDKGRTTRAAFALK